MKKEFASITTLRLDYPNKHKLERIIKAKMRVTARTQTGAVRQMIGEWETLVAEIERLESDNRTLRKENERFSEMIETHVANDRAMQAVFDRKQGFAGKIKEAECSLPYGRRGGQKSA